MILHMGLKPSSSRVPVSGWVQCPITLPHMPFTHLCPWLLLSTGDSWTPDLGNQGRGACNADSGPARAVVSATWPSQDYGGWWRRGVGGNLAHTQRWGSLGQAGHHGMALMKLGHLGPG